MSFSHKKIEELAPDQASLAAAAKLANPGKWVSLSNEADLWWGECQGSGANPYRAVVDAGVIGYKCTCPSRKFPCKHSLALMLLVVDAPAKFSPGTAPQWVNDWLSRRRPGTAPAKPGASANKSLAAVEADVETPVDPAVLARREAARTKRAQNTRAMIAAGLDELDQWIDDQLGGGLIAFADNAADRCRRIAARLVDHKAAGLASRLDEMPSRLDGLTPEERPDAIIRELGKLVVLTKAWRANPDEPQAARDVGASENRDDVLASQDATRVRGCWEVLGTQVRTRRDGLVSHSTWFLEAAGPTFALLLDYFPASAGRREAAFTPGDTYDATMVFYPSRGPLRALATDMVPMTYAPAWPVLDAADPLAQIMPALKAVPWQLEFPLLLGAGRVFKQDDRFWLTSGLPLAALPPGLWPQLAGVELSTATGVWDGQRLTLLTAGTPWGKVTLQ